MSDKLADLLKSPEYDEAHIEKYVSYCRNLQTEKKKGTNELVNKWAPYVKDEMFAAYFKRVAKDGLVFDGVHITLQSTGISYDYVAYKNKMLLTYPESVVDVSLVYKGDEFSVSKESGKVEYSHMVADPFNKVDDNIIGGYAVIKNRRGESLTTLSKAEIAKHRNVAKQDYIWKAWFAEMCMKTIIKKACKQHYADIYQEIDEEDNKQNNLENPVDLELTYKQEIDDIETVDELKDYYLKNKGKGKDFDKYVTMKKQLLTQPTDENL